MCCVCFARNTQESTRSKFETATTCIGSQYSAYSPLPGEHINGNLTMGENIAGWSACCRRCGSLLGHCAWIEPRLAFVRLTDACCMFWPPRSESDSGLGMHSLVAWRAVLMDAQTTAA